MGRGAVRPSLWFIALFINPYLKILEFSLLFIEKKSKNSFIFSQRTFGTISTKIILIFCFNKKKLSQTLVQIILDIIDFFLGSWDPCEVIFCIHMKCWVSKSKLGILGKYSTMKILVLIFLKNVKF